MAINWTDEQKNAINRRGATLVSAAAGSGKTAVLVERVLRRLTDGDDPCDIDEFLIVTFNKAAAGEMRAKIADALMEKLLASPGDRRLARQLNLLARAQITTVHSFCAALLRDNFQAAGIAPDLRVADEDEAAILRESALDELIEDRYEDSTPENSEFFLLADALSSTQNDSRLRAVILEAFLKVQSHPYPEKWLRGAEAAYNAAQGDALGSPFGDILFDELKKRCAYALRSMEWALREMERYPVFNAAYAAVWADDIENIRSLADFLSRRDWEGARALAAGISFKRLPPARGASYGAIGDVIKSTREDWKKTLAAMREEYFSSSGEQFTEGMASAAPYARALAAAVRDFGERFENEKRLRGILDFGDLEHLALKALVGADGETPTPLAAAYSRRFREVMVDEYQDTNEVQDAIFRALSQSGRRLFMVGDVKQSIYRFRLADPGVFLRKYRDASDDPAPGETGRVVLASNFRSRAEVTDAVNFIFSHIMSPDLGDIDYAGSERLAAGADYPPMPGRGAELCLVSADDDDDLTSLEADARYVASRISRMLKEGFEVFDRAADGLRPCEPGDFAVLLRSVKDKAAVYERALLGAGIPAACDTGEQLFDSPEIITLMSFIDVLDNPEQDIPLASLMRSPVYGFTADELARIRAAAPGSYYTALRSFAEGDDETARRCRTLLCDLENLRRDAQDLPSDRLILKIVDGAGLRSLTGGGGGLRHFLELARRFERAGYRGLYRFAQMARSLKKRGYETSPGLAPDSAVRIMSVHKSKGLEFPVVFLSNCGSRFNLRDLAEPVLIHPKLGFAFRRRDLARRIEYPTLARLAISLLLRRETLCEEERILYVAMTRAKEKLILTAPVKNAAALAARCFAASRLAPLPPQYLVSSPSPLYWVLTPILRLPCAEKLLTEAELNSAPPQDGDSWTLRAEPPGESGSKPRRAAQQEDFPLTEDELFTRLSFRYPHAQAPFLPSKLTATELKGRYTDEEVFEDAAQDAAARERRPRTHSRPAFAEGGALNAAERGTALHLFMQLANFDECRTLEGIEGELKRLGRGRFITPQQAEAVNAHGVLRFFTSPLGQRALRSNSLAREFKFSLLVPPEAASDPEALAVKPAPDGDAILFQGVVDCYFEENGALVIIDFKTDYAPPGAQGEIARRYRPQLAAYAAALFRITGKPVAGRYIFLFSSGQAVEV